MASDRRDFILGGTAFLTLLSANPSLVALAETAVPRPDAAPQFFFLKTSEARFLEAVCDHMIPADAFPSGSEAGCVAFFDLQLATDFGDGRWLYLEGPFQDGKPEQGYQLPYAPSQLYRRAIAAADEAAGPDGFAGLDDAGREQFLKTLDGGDITLDDIPGKVFFDELYANVMQAYFADPIHNGNKDMSSWRMIGFPGAHAYYLTEVDRWNMDYLRPPSGVAFVPGVGSPPPLRPAPRTASASVTNGKED